MTERAGGKVLELRKQIIFMYCEILKLGPVHV